MAIRFPSVTSLLCLTSLCPSSLRATPLLVPTNSCLSPPFKHCSRLRVQCASSFKSESEVQSVELAAKFHESELPPLLASLAIPGLPRCQDSMYVDEALARIMKRWPYNWLQSSVLHVCASFTSFAHPSTVSCDREAAVASTYVLLTFLDDTLFDGRNDILREECGIDVSCDPHSIRGCLHSLNVILRQEEPLRNPTPIQEMIWRLGCDVRELSNPEWFCVFADAILDYFDSTLASYTADVEGEGHCKYGMDLESYTKMRIRNAGGLACGMCVEIGCNAFLPTEVREHPVVHQLTTFLWIYNAYANDIFSYTKEQDEPYSRNLIKVLMESEGLSLPEATWKAVNLTNSVARDFMELEAQLPMWEEEQKAFVARRYVQGLKEFMSGILYWHSLSKRYRHPEAPFPELRDMSASFCPKAEYFRRV